MNSTERMQLPWLIAMMAVYVLGHLTVFFLYWYLVNVSLIYLYSVPAPFTAILIVIAILGRKGRLLSNECGFPRVTFLVALFSVATWVWVIYAYLRVVLNWY